MTNSLGNYQPSPISKGNPPVCDRPYLAIHPETSRLADLTRTRRIVELGLGLDAEVRRRMFSIAEARRA